jgi:hypothetical protein
MMDLIPKELEKALREYMANVPETMTEELFMVRGDVQILLSRLEDYRKKKDGASI